MNNKFYIAAQQVGFKSPLRDHLAFVGRKREKYKLQVCCTGEQVTSVWIWGPRRIGKTSLSYKVDEIEGINILRVSCDKHSWENLDDFLLFIKNEINKENGSKLSQNDRNILIELAKKSSKTEHIILVLDEFDGIGVNLQKIEQAFIRSTLHRFPFFGIIFITRLNPIELLQDYSDENSRLLGVCDIIRVPFLEKLDLYELLRKIEKIIEKKLNDWIADWIFERVSGYSVAVQIILRNILIHAATEQKLPDMQQLDYDADLFYDELKNELQGIWYDLPHELKKYYLDSSQEISLSTKREMRALNLMSKNKIYLPIWIQRIGKKVGLQLQNKQENLTEFIELAEMLTNRIKLCNEISLKKGHTQIFQITQQSLNIFDLARQVETETELNRKISVLHKLCVENTNSDQLPGKDKCLIPENHRKLYKKSRGFMTLVAWRNFSFHDPSKDLKPANQSTRYKNIGEICCQYLGANCYRAQSKEDLNIIYKGILKDVIISVTELSDAIENEKRT